MRAVLSHLCSGRALDEQQTSVVFESLMGAGREAITDAQIGAYLMATGSRRVSAAELTGAARSLRRHMVPVVLDGRLAAEKLLDTCGTGGSGLDTFNTSTVAAIVAAGCGQMVAKHGNRAATSRCGSADLLSALGVKTELAAYEIARCIELTRFGFMLAPLHHPATKRVQLIRRELGFRTIFNFLGPLCNPASVSYQLLGVSDRSMIEAMAESLAALAIERAMVVCGSDGLDELTLSGPSYVAEVREGKVSTYSLEPEKMGLSRQSLTAVQGGTPEESSARVRRILDGEQGPYRDLVLLNSSAALFVSGRCADMLEGIELARKCIDSGKAREILQSVIRVTNSL